MEDNIIEIKNLTKRFGNKIVIDNLNFEVKYGDFFGLLGRNGAGKSTLINILVGLYNFNEGVCQILGHDAKELDRVKKEIGVMPDVANLYSEMNAYEFISYMGVLKGIKLDEQSIGKLLTKVGLDIQKKVKIKNFSFGMKKKISIAQAIIGEPKIIFLDEPTSGVDPESILKLQNLFLQLNREGRTIFITSHNLQEIEKLCNKLAILKNGNFEINGRLEDIINDYNKNKVIIKVNSKDTQKAKLALTETKLEQEENMFCILYSDETEIEKVIECLVKNKVGIHSVVQQKATLEEIFLK